MTEKQIISAFLFILFIIGIVDLVISLVRIKRRKKRAQAYLSEFRAFVNAYLNQNFDGERYDWLMLHQENLSGHLAGVGIHLVQSSHSQFITRHFSVIEKLLPAMRSGNAESAAVANGDDLLLRYIGLMENDRHHFYHNLINPFVWLRACVQVLLWCPFCLLGWFGIMEPVKIAQVARSAFFRVISAFIGLAVLIIALSSLIWGWAQVWQHIDTYTIRIGDFFRQLIYKISTGTR